MKTYKINTLDGYILNGYLDKSRSSRKVKDRIIVIYTHGITSNAMEYKNRVMAKILNKNGIDFFSFTNRGAEIMIRLKCENPDMKLKLAGSAFEDIFECENDIIGAINKVIELGYKNIILLGHSMASTKMMYTYENMQKNKSKFLEYIKAIGLLSLVDIPQIAKIGTSLYYQNMLEVLKKKKSQGQGFEIITLDYLTVPISVDTLLNYIDPEINKKLDFINIHQGGHLKHLNEIDVPLFMRWGDTKELVEYPVKRYVNIVKKKITKQDSDIDYIEGADHNFTGYEKQLANEFVQFIKKYTPY